MPRGATARTVRNGVEVVGADDRPMNSDALAAILESIGSQIRGARLARSWYLSDLAERVGISQSVVCRMELARREASFYQVVSTCAALNMRFSGVLRQAEDHAFPYGHGPWDQAI
jgi:ribosome-binding protein aMBF1 (putative translation factor)